MPSKLSRKRLTEELPPLYVVHVDVDITRRKRFHWIDNPEGQREAMIRKWSDVLAWLDERKIVRFIAMCDETAYTVELKRADQYWRPF